MSSYTVRQQPSVDWSMKFSFTKINHKPQGTAEGVAMLMSDPVALTLERNATAANERPPRAAVINA